MAHRLQKRERLQVRMALQMVLQTAARSGAVTALQTLLWALLGQPDAVVEGRLLELELEQAVLAEQPAVT